MNTTKGLWAVLSLCMLLLCSHPALAAAEKYDITGHGKLILQVPEGWTGGLTPEKNRPTTLRFSPNTQEKGLVSITVFYDQEGMAGFNSAENIKKSVIAQGKAIIPQAVETELNLFPLKRESVAGYFFALTDKDTKPEGFKTVTQGGIRTGNLLLMFTVLTDSMDSEIIKDTLKMLKTSLQRT